MSTNEDDTLITHYEYLHLLASTCTNIDVHVHLIKMRQNQQQRNSMVVTLVCDLIVHYKGTQVGIAQPL